MPNVSKKILSVAYWRSNISFYSLLHILNTLDICHRDLFILQTLPKHLITLSYAFSISISTMWSSFCISLYISISLLMRWIVLCCRSIRHKVRLVFQYWNILPHQSLDHLFQQLHHVTKQFNISVIITVLNITLVLVKRANSIGYPFARYLCSPESNIKKLCQQL